MFIVIYIGLIKLLHIRLGSARLENVRVAYISYTNLGRLSLELEFTYAR